MPLSGRLRSPDSAAIRSVVPMVGRVAADADCNRCRRPCSRPSPVAVRAPRLDLAPLTLASEAP